MSEYVDRSVVTPPYAQRRGRAAELLGYISPPAILLVALWFSLNTGPWNLRRMPESLYQSLHSMRALFPLVALPLAVGYLFIIKPTLSPERRLPYPLRLWLIYGAIAMVAGIAMSPRPIDASYWGVAYLSSLAVMASYLRSGDPVNRAMQANRVSWMVNFIFLLILAVFARNALFTSVGGRAPVDSIRVMADMPMSRSSGMGRFAAVPGVLAFVLMIRSGWLKRIFWAAVFILSAFIVYKVQSRGAMIGFAWAVLVSAYLLGRRGKLILFFIIVIGVFLLSSDVWPERIWTHITRADTAYGLHTLGGRTVSWRAAWPFIQQSPIWGWGFQGDRMLIRDAVSNVHNTYLYALISAGFLGLAFFVIGLLKAWTQLLSLVRSGFARSMGQEAFLAQVGGVLAFFTIRSITEVSGPLFAVDLLVMLPGILYIGVMHRRMEAIKANSRYNRNGLRPEGSE